MWFKFTYKKHETDRQTDKTNERNVPKSMAGPKTDRHRQMASTQNKMKQILWILTPHSQDDTVFFFVVAVIMGFAPIYCVKMIVKKFFSWICPWRCGSHWSLTLRVNGPWTKVCVMSLHTISYCCFVSINWGMTKSSHTKVYPQFMHAENSLWC